MDMLLKKYQDLVIWRQAFIMIVAAPVPAAVVKLQGELLNAQMISIIMILVNVMVLSGVFLNKYLCAKALFISGNCVSAIAAIGIAVMYYYDVDNEALIIYFPIVSALGFMLVGLASAKLKNKIKDKFGDKFDLSHYEAKKSSVTSGATIVGQGLAVGFYSMDFGVANILIIVVLEFINMVFYMLAEYQRWQLAVAMGIDK